MAKSFLFALGRQRAIDLPRVAQLAEITEGWLLRGAWALAKFLGPDWASRCGGWFFERLGPYLAKNNHVVRNLAVAFPQLDKAKRAAVARQVWYETGRVIAEIPNLDVICGREADKRLEVIDHYGLDEVQQNRKVAVFVTAHYGNWELSAGVGRILKLNLNVLHTHFSNPRIEQLLMSHRRALGCNFIPRQHGARGIIKALQRGQNVGVVMDQRYDEGKMVPFFGVPTPTGTAAAAIALKLNVDFVPVRVERKNGANFRVTFYKKISHYPELPADQRALAMTADVLAQFESWIRERPELWMCLKRRWPKSMPHVA